MLLCLGPQSQREAARGQGHALGGASGQRTGESFSGPARTEQLHRQVWSRNLLCRRAVQPERKSLSVSAPPPPPPPRLATTAEVPHIPAQGAESGVEPCGYIPVTASP